MNNISTILLSIFFVSLSSFALSQTHEEAGRKIDSLFASYNSQTPGAAVAIVKDGKVIFRKGYGMANLDHDIPVTPQTVFNIASLSKQFTAFAIYLLESEGKLTFEDDVRKYIPELPFYGSPIKIKHLLAHTSGLRDQAALSALAGGNPGDVITTEKIMKLVTRQKGLNFKPGSAFNYNNTGYTLLAEIVARISGKTFAVYTHEKIFQPLGMTSTMFYDNQEKIVKNKAESYAKVINVYSHKVINTSNVGPSNLMTTVEDLSKWVLNFENPIIGNRQLITAFNQPSYLDNGEKVILRIIDGVDTIFHAKGQNLSNYKGVTMISHGGHAAAFRSFLGRFPDQHLSIIALSNDEHNENLNARWSIADFYIKNYLKEENTTSAVSTQKSAKPPVTYSSNLSDFEGDYYSDELSTGYTLKVKENKLILSHLRLDDLSLNRVGDNHFSGSGPQTFSFEMEFLRNDKTAVTGFIISNFGVKRLPFVKMK
jgi:CubicO group peptidase (beta-lactamase class C family)